MAKTNITIKNIALELGISASTVSRALNDHPRIGTKTKERVRELAKKLHYVPNPAARLLKNNKTLKIGILLPFLKEEFFSMAISAIEDAVLPHNYHVMVSQSRDNLEREKKMVDAFISTRIDGLIVSVSAETNHYGHFKVLEDYGIPVVFFDRVPRNFEANKVHSNVTTGTIAVIQFLVNKGIKKIAIINGPGNLQASDERLNGYLETINKFGLSTSQKYIKSSNLTREETTKGMFELCDLTERPEAVLTFNDYVALDAMAACRQKGLIPNKDILFVSFANLPFTSLLENPPMASVEQFPSVMGTRSAELLLTRMQSDEPLPYEEIVLKSELRIH
ncbi:LacI family DNA-binding transcriptional regulator [Arcticibacterium luteifluviistationis]|uniref:LacI family transcriptional regulator n=1 Tax=Arcticibacterium luteifluviistationis TaxID=1784714 RepID=A0A2Z4GAZ4_9BACT|nr:LacI family DNA-binding transcriptional regulator [Arcticibacterium luteifluviistationis]AWV98314.1 LacI family transcriptional regulator [Arcticibacterium luteifluviistationis]